jgi:histidinol phosphatase-like enzyme (inositol monophosphatase family)
MPHEKLDLAGLADFACILADAAREAAAGWSGCMPENKALGGAFDPVTEADKAAERTMRGLIGERFPEHGISGEEYGETTRRSPWWWSLDPIDGTRAFMCGLPTWVILIALMHEDQAVLGIVDAPRLGERYIGHGDTGVLRSALGESRLRSADCKRLSEARLATTDPFLFQGAESRAFAAARAESRLVRYGLDGYAYARLAAGTLDLVIESGLKPYDYNALIPVIRAAGGVVGDWRGGNGFSGGQIIAAATPELFEEAVALLRDAAA